MLPHKNSSVGPKLVSYFEAQHGSAAGWAKDACVSTVSFLPGIIGIAIRTFWDRFFINGTGKFVVESGVRILGSGFISIDDGVYIDNGVYLHGRPGGLEIGGGTRIMHGAVLHVYNFRALDCSGIKIGKNCVIGINSIITGQGGVVIEDDVIIAPNVMILPVDHVHGDPDVPIKDQGLSTKGIIVRKGAWLGAGSIILDGVEIGKNAVVGAGSVVTKNVAHQEKVAGNPARKVESDKMEN
jgi:acetyltransferase-like isoleucine patch superfamily enzyme